jgi:hypothetical protein
MLYVTVPVGDGHHGFKLPNVSLRFGEGRLGGNSGNPTAGDPMQHRELLRLEVAGRQSDPALDMRVAIGGRLSYDLNRGVFALRADSWKRPSSVPAVASSHGPDRLQTKFAANERVRVAAGKYGDPGESHPVLLKRPGALIDSIRGSPLKLLK